MRRQMTLALGSMFIGFMGVAWLARNGHLAAMGYDGLQLIACGALLGSAITIFVKSLKSANKSIA
jgi:hypothetical protein